MRVFKRQLRLMVIIWAFSCTAAVAQEIWTIGPMTHINIGGEKHSKAFSIEAAYWNITHFIYSVDAGVEIEKGKLRLYSGGQTGLGVTGVSFGPVVQFNFRESKIRAGFQGSVWINHILGVDYRMRFTAGHKLMTGNDRD